jgi:hypothetical protein
LVCSEEVQGEEVKVAESRLRRIIKNALLSEKCWDGYRPGAQSGVKTKVGKSGKRVANCEKIKEVDGLDELEETDHTLWDHIRAKRARGERPARPGEKDYPSAKAWQSATESDRLEEEDGPYEPMIKATEKIIALPEALQYHISAGVGVDRNIFRPGSTAFFALFREARRHFYEGTYEPASIDEYELLEDLDIGEFAIHEGQLVPLDYPIIEGNEDHLNEAEYKGKKVKLNKPIQGSPKAYVYVNSGKKTKDGKIKVKKVSFGSSMPDAMGDSDAAKKRRKSFGDRHNCSDKDDKTKPGYWSCRATKFFGRDIAGWW